jgi:hypothetical protein
LNLEAPLQREKIIAIVQQWLETFVVNMNLCPFAKREIANDRLRLILTGATSEAQLLMALQDELELLNADSSVETTLLIHTEVLRSFTDYNQFLHCVDGLLTQMALDGVYQIASFHPDYQFADTSADDAENYTNRSPYPMLHIIREASVERAIAEFPGVEQIPTANIALMNRLGTDRLKALMNTCINHSEE